MPTSLNRRQLIHLLSAGSGLLLAACATPTPPPATGGTPTPAELPTVPAEMWTPPTSPRITPIDDFYTMKYHPTPPPQVDEADYRLVVEGLVDRPLSLSLGDLRALPMREEMRTLQCISNPVGGKLIGNGMWQGLAFADLLAQAGVQPRGRYLKLESIDGYHTGIPTQLAQDPASLLVYAMNGETLPAKHGHPLRCLFPGRYGQKQPKWIQRITVQDRPHIGHFEGQGWSDEAPIRPTSIIEAPQSGQSLPLDFVVHGVAFTDASGLATLDVSLDNGGVWQPAQLLRGESGYVWTHWWLRVAGTEPGDYRILARVTDGDGKMQSRQGRQILEGAFPDGTDEMQLVIARVRA